MIDDQERIKDYMDKVDSLTPRERAVVHQYGFAPALDAIARAKGSSISPEKILMAQGRDPIPLTCYGITPYPRAAHARRVARRFGLKVSV